MDFSQRSIYKVAIENAKEQFFKNRKLIQFYLDNIQAKLDAIQNSEIFRTHANQSDFADSQVKDLFLSIARSDNFLMQLRFLNINGNEILRVERNVCYALPYVINDSSLQNKSKRYYFRKILSLHKGE